MEPTQFNPAQGINVVDLYDRVLADQPTDADIAFYIQYLDQVKDPSARVDGLVEYIRIRGKRPRDFQKTLCSRVRQHPNGREFHADLVTAMMIGAVNKIGVAFFTKVNERQDEELEKLKEEERRTIRQIFLVCGLIAISVLVVLARIAYMKSRHGSTRVCSGS